MNNLFIVMFIILLHQVDFFVASGPVDEFKTRLQAEQINFLSSNVHDIECVKNILDLMYKLDQDVRQVCMHDRKNTQLHIFLEKMDEFHTQMMKAIISIHGWPKISQFGPQADHQAWLLVQHADRDVLFQEQCLFILHELIYTKETNSKNYAYLYDRVGLKSQAMGMKQKYGTQYSILDSGEILLQPCIGSMKYIDSHRAQMGLMPSEAYIEQIKLLYVK